MSRLDHLPSRCNGTKHFGAICTVIVRYDGKETVGATEMNTVSLHVDVDTHACIRRLVTKLYKGIGLSIEIHFHVYTSITCMLTISG